jgi:hypothetical protein
MNPWFGGSIEIMTPGLQFLPTRPRFFVHGDVQYVFATPRSLARDGDPADAVMEGLPPGFQLTYGGTDEAPGIPPGWCVDNDPPGYCDDPPGPDARVFRYPPTGTLVFPRETERPNAPSLLVKGQGTKVLVTEDSWVWSGGAGVAFTFELFGRRLRLKPSLEYQRRKLSVEWTANRALLSQEQGVRRPPSAGGNIAPIYNIIQLAAQDELVVDGLGPGLELEMDTWQVGPVMLSLYLSGQAYRVLGNTVLTAQGDITTECGATDGSNLALLCQQTNDWDLLFLGTQFSRQRFPTDTALSGLGVNDVFGDFGFEIDPWYLQAGIGLRFRGVPDYWIPNTRRDLEIADMPRPSWLSW